MKKKFFALALSLALAFAFSACSLNINRAEYLDFVNTLSETTVKGCIKIETIYSRGFGITAETYASQGSGVIYEYEEGWYYALTNNHVVAEDASFPSYAVTLYDCYGNPYDNCEVVKNSAEDDLAVVKFAAERDMAGEYPDLYVVPFAEEGVDKGDVVASVGAPDGKFNSVTLGKVRGYSAVELTESVASSAVTYPVVCHTAITHQGSSGGMLVNEKSQIVGVNFAGAVTESESGGETFFEGYAIPLNKILNFLGLGGNLIAW